MALFLTLLPVYLFGNVHCLGMCGPLVVLIGQHRYRLLYFLGRLLAFSCAGLLAGGAGAVLDVIFKQIYLSEMISLLFGTWIFGFGLSHLFGWSLPQWSWLLKHLAKANSILSNLLLKDRGWSTFLFGCATVLLPCGQTLLVFSACALTGSLSVGLINGFAFALLTSPALWLAMHAHQLLRKCKHYYHPILGISSLGIGALAWCRGFAELGWIPHWTVNLGSPYHLVIF